MPKSTEPPDQLQLGDQIFLPRSTGSVEIPIGHLITHDVVSLRMNIRRGRKPGPVLLVCAAVHGDEINGVEIIRRLEATRLLRRMSGTLITIPVVNIPAFQTRSRYLPDRRDLNRLFPGSTQGSFGSRLASVLVKDVIKQCTHGIDLHTGAINRPNLPQIRFSRDVEQNHELAMSFGAPVAIESPVRPGSMREVFTDAGKPLIMYEAGDALTLDPTCVTMGVRGILSVMRKLGMLPAEKNPPKQRTVVSRRTWWERAPRGGVLIPKVEMGKAVTAGTVLGTIGDPFSPTDTHLLSSADGIVIGRTREALVDEGDGVFHIAVTNDPESDVRHIERTERLTDDQFDQPVFDDAYLD